MYSLDELTVKRFHLFKEATLPFRDGITVISGENASGKSLLTSAIPTALSLIYKDDFEAAPKSSFIGLKYMNDDVAIDYSVTTNASAKYAIGIGGEDMMPHKKVDAKNLLLKNWTIPQALFDSTIFLRGTDKHALSVGTPGTRSTWLSEALDLTAIYDAYKAQVDEKISELGRLLAKKEILEEELDKVMSRIPDSSISKKKARIAAKLLKKHRLILKKLPAEKVAMENVVKIVSEIEELPELDKSVSYYQKKLSKYEKELERLEDIESKLEEYREAKRHNASIEAKINELAIFEEMDDKSYRKLAAKVKECESIIDSYVEANNAYKDQQDEREELEKLSSYEISTHNLEEAENLLASLVFRTTQREDQLEALKSLSSKTKECPTCGNELTKDHVAKEIKAITKELKALPEEVKIAKREVRYWKLKKIKFVKKPKKPNFTSKEFDDWQTQLIKYEAAIELKSQLRDIPKVKTKGIAIEIKSAKASARKYANYVKSASSIAAYIKMLPEDLQDMNRDQLVDIKASYEAKLAEISSTIQHSNEIVRKYSEIENKYDLQTKLVAQHRSSVNSLKASIEEMREETKDIAAWKALAVAFGNSGVRLYQLKESAAVLSKQLTELSALFFDSTYYFNIEVAPHKLNVMVERNGKVGSVKTLSGAETRSWNLLCAMSLIRSLPSKMRCDTIFLDEIEANMNKRSRERYVRDVLPELQSIVPKINVITPLINGELNINATYDYRVVKDYKKGEYFSRLIEN